MISFREFFDDFGKSKVVHKETKVIPYTLKLWRGFNGDLKNFEFDENHYLFQPDRSDQNMLWFTHPFIRYYRPIEYAKDHGQWFFSHEIVCKKHVQINHWDDKTQSNDLPDYWDKLAQPTENSQYHFGIELPQGWVFSYKSEKFVGCPTALKVLKTAVVPSDSVQG